MACLKSPSDGFTFKTIFCSDGILSRFEGDSPMAKLTMKQRDELRYTLRNAERALAYIESPATAVCRVGSQATTTLHFSRAIDDRTLYEVNTDIGSDIVGLRNAIDSLASFIVRN